MRRIEHHDYVTKLSANGGRQVIMAADLVAAGRLRQIGFVTAEDTHDGPEIVLTDAGRKYIERWIVQDSIAVSSSMTPTESKK